MSRHWSDFLGCVWKRLTIPWGHPTFVLNFVILVLVGAAGWFWRPLLEEVAANTSATIPERMAQGIGTYVLGIASAALATVLVSVGGDGDQFTTTPNSFRMFAFLLFIVTVMFSLFSILFKTLCVGLPAITFGLLLWLLANANNRTFQDQVPPEASTGGNPLAQLHGDLKGIET